MCDQKFCAVVVKNPELNKGKPIEELRQAAACDASDQNKNASVECICQLSFYFQSEVSYGTYQSNSLESFAEVLLRTGKLAETKTEGRDLLPTTEGMDIFYRFTPCMVNTEVSVGVYKCGELHRTI